jgi:hypothetical protein
MRSTPHRYSSNVHLKNHSESYNCADEDFENTLKDNVATTTGLLFGAPIVTETQSFNTTLDQVVTDLQELSTKNCYTWVHLQQMLEGLVFQNRQIFLPVLKHTGPRLGPLLEFYKIHILIFIIILLNWKSLL